MDRTIKAMKAFQGHYQQNGISSLINCEGLPEFHELFESLNQIRLEDVGLNPSPLETYFKENTLTYMKVLEDTETSIDLFCLPKGNSFKLHDHTNMLVLTKMLAGSVHYRSFDLVDRSFQENSKNNCTIDENSFSNDIKLEAILHTDKVLKAHDISYLTPKKGNIHSILAQEDSILVDILIPSYYQTQICNYYEELELPAGDSGKGKGDTEGNKEKAIKYSHDLIGAKNLIAGETSSGIETRAFLRPILPPADTLIRVLQQKPPEDMMWFVHE